MTILKKIWFVWAKSLGAKPEGLTDRQADFTASIRTVWVIVHLVTCGFMIAGNGCNLHLW